MARPRKRRRLSEFDPQSAQPTSDVALFEPMPTLIGIHTINELATPPEFPGTRPVPKRIEEIHLQIQQQAVDIAQSEHACLHRRQLSGSAESVVSTVNAAGSSIISTITNAVGATSASPTTATVTPATTTNSSRGLTASTGVSPSPNSSTNTTSPSLSHTAGSHNSTGTGVIHHTTPTSHTTTLPPTYLATLANNQVKTITRSSRPYVTTFGDGEKSTICDRFGECQVAIGGKTSSKFITTHAIHTHITASSATVTPSGSSAAAVAGSGSSPSTPAASSSSTGAASNNQNSNTSTPPPATIAGGVVGGAAGIAVILLIALVLLRWYKRRAQNGHRALPAGSSASPETGQQQSLSQSGMMERTGLAPLASVLPPLFRHQNKTREQPPSSTEQGFTKVSGRKLPSAFSEGMTRSEMSASPAPDMPLNEAEYNVSRNMSFYRDSRGFYGGTGGEGGEHDMSSSPAESGGPFADPDPTLAPITMTLSPGPQRRPTIHTPASYAMPSAVPPPGSSGYQPVQSSTSGAALSPYPTVQADDAGSGGSEMPTFVRSETPSTIADNRSSRFTEDV